MRDKINNIAHLNDGTVSEQYQIKGMNVSSNKKNRLFLKKDKKKLSQENRLKYSQLTNKRGIILNKLDELRKELKIIDEQINELFM